MTDHRMVGSVRTCPFLGKFPLAQSIGPVLCFAQWLDVPDLGGGSLSLCLSAEALVHVAEATSIVAEATTLINIYTSECHLLALTPAPNATLCMPGCPPRHVCVAERRSLLTTYLLTRACSVPCHLGDLVSNRLVVRIPGPVSCEQTWTIA